MPALEVHNMRNMLAASNPIADGFIKARRAATAAGFIVYCGILSATVAVWMWMGATPRFNSEPSPQLRHSP